MPEGNSSPLPEGKYVMSVVETKLQDTKAGTGKYIRSTFRVVEGTHTGRTIIHMWNIVNPNPKAVKIGKESLKQFLVNSGHGGEKLDSVTDLMGLRAFCSVKVTKREDGRGDNKITWFGQVPGTHTAPQNTTSVNAEVPNYAPSF